MEHKIPQSARDYSPVTPHHTLKEFLTSSIHQDFLHELAIRIEDLRDYYEFKCDSRSYLETRGSLVALRTMETIFEDLHANAQSDQTREEK